MFHHLKTPLGRVAASHCHKATIQHQIFPSLHRVSSSISSNSARGLFGIAMIETSETGVHTRFGKVIGMKNPGLNFYFPFVDQILVVNNRVIEDNFRFEVMTGEHTFVNLEIAIQVKILPEDSIKALFELGDPLEQMRSYVENVIRSQVPYKNLDQLFKEQEEIGQNIKEALAENMKKFGITIVNTLIRKIDPEASVKTAMNAVIASAKLRDAARNEGEAKRIKMVEEAKGDAERKRLQGQGISDQRIAILRGYQDGMDEMAAKLGLAPLDVINFVIRTQELDTMEGIGRSQNAKTIFLSPSNGLKNNKGEELRKAFIEAEQVNK